MSIAPVKSMGLATELATENWPEPATRPPRQSLLAATAGERITMRARLESVRAAYLTATLVGRAGVLSADCSSSRSQRYIQRMMTIEYVIDPGTHMMPAPNC
jgi:hypothetical protein